MYSEQTLYGLTTLQAGAPQTFDHAVGTVLSAASRLIDVGIESEDVDETSPWTWFGPVADGRRRAEDDDDDFEEDFDDDDDDDFDDDLDDDFDDDDFDEDDDDDDFDDDFDEDDL